MRDQRGEGIANLRGDPSLTSTQFAQLMGVKVSQVYRLRATDPRFPQPLPSSERSTMYAEGDVVEYLRLRADGARSAAGRRPRIAVSTADEDAPFAERLRSALRIGTTRSGITTQRELAALLGLSVATFGNRMRGRTRWKRAELSLIARLLGVDVADANTLFRGDRG